MSLRKDLRSVHDGVDPPFGDLTRLMMDAGRKRRVLTECLGRLTRLHRNFSVFGAFAGFAAACSGSAMYFDLGSWRYLLPIAIVTATLSGLAAAASLALDRRTSRDDLAADTTRCGLIIDQIQALRAAELKTELGSRVLNGLLQDFKAVADRHMDLDGVDFVPKRRDPRFAVRSRSVTCTLRDGEKRVAQIRDLSRSGVALRTDIKVGPGTVVTIGSTPARAVRITEDGMAFEFLKPFPRERFSLDVVL